ncbi:uncharacterized protein LOC106467297 [Limulus polyphemus]|uniref:Uncharacterized protein LOC106467297 n=1 Tax=Limulus polyphemus TaxID=6850 RepID=A0ABM1T5J4_LIMPO|nr:uncharacterized protein LOC106467297 [Limulus polyphemus]
MSEQEKLETRSSLVCVDCIHCPSQSTVKRPENSNNQTPRVLEDKKIQPDTFTGSSQVQRSFEPSTESLNIHESYNSVTECSKIQQSFKLETGLPGTQKPVLDNIVKPSRVQLPSLTSDPEPSSVHRPLEFTKQEHEDNIENSSPRDCPVEEADKKDRRGHLPAGFHENFEKEEEEEKESDEKIDAFTVSQPEVLLNRNLGDVHAISEEEDETSPAQFRLADSALNSDTASTLNHSRDVQQTHCKAPGINVRETSSRSEEKIDKPFNCVDTEEPSQIDGDILPQDGGQQQQCENEIREPSGQSGTQSLSQQTLAPTSFVEQKYHQYPEMSTDIPMSDSLRLINSITQVNSQNVVADNDNVSVPVTSVSRGDHHQQQVAQFSQPKAHQQIVLQAIPTKNLKNIDLQGQKKQKAKPDPQDWSPVSDLSPIMDVSPSVEAAEQEFMEKFRQKSEEAEQSKPIVHTTIPRATSGTISGMIADFNKALGLSGSYPIKNQKSKVNSTRNITMSPLRSLVDSVREDSALKDQNQNVVPQDAEEEHQAVSKPDKDSVASEHLPQPSTSRRIHRRLPQPTMEQMQAAVVMAAQTPRGKVSPQTMVKPIDTQNSLVNVPIKSLSSTPPISPSVLSGKLHDKKQSEQILAADSFTDQHLTNQKAFTSSHSVQSLISPVVLMCGVTSFVTSSTTTMTTVTSRQVIAGTSPLEPNYVESKPPTLGVEKDLCTKDSSLSRNGSAQNPRILKDKTGENSDTQSESDSSKSGKIRRKLPPLPRDQEPSPVSARRSKNRTRNLSIGSIPVHLAEKRWAQRTSSLDSAPQTRSTGDLIRMSRSDYHIQQSGKLGSQVSETATTYQKSTSSIHKSPLMAPVAVSQRLGLAEISLAGSKLPTYVQNLKQQMREELRTVSEEQQRLLDIRDKTRSLYRRSETDLASLLPSVWSDEPASEFDTHPPSTSPFIRRSISACTSPQESPKKSRHRRHASDPKHSRFLQIRDTLPTECDMTTFNSMKDHNTRSEAFKYFDFESIDRLLSYEGVGRVDWHQDGRQKNDHMVSERLSNIMSDKNFQTFSREMPRTRTVSQGSSHTLPATFNRPFDQWQRNLTAQFLSNEREKREENKSRKPRSWHPSPYVSEDEDDEITREEKKAKVKEEINRRRKKIEENCRLYDELHQVAKTLEANENRDSGYLLDQSIVYNQRTSDTTTCTTSDTFRLRQVDTARPTITGNVFQAIDELLKKEDYSTWSTESNAQSGSHYTTAPSIYSTASVSGYDYLANTGGDPKRHGNKSHSSAARFPENTVEDESIAKIAATFPTEKTPNINFRIRSQPLPHFDSIMSLSPMAEVSTPTPAMPLLPDMPTRSRKRLEDLGSSPIVSQLARDAYSDEVDADHSSEPNADCLETSGNATVRQARKAQDSIVQTSQKYDFPVKRILLTRDSKDRSVSGNGLGMKVVGGKEIPGNAGVIGAYIAKIYPGGVVETLGEVREGDRVLEWNGIPLTGKTYEDVQRLVAASRDEVEIVIRDDVIVHDSRAHQRRSPRKGPRDLRNSPESGKSNSNQRTISDYNSNIGPDETDTVPNDHTISNSSSYDNVETIDLADQKPKGLVRSNCSPLPGSDNYEPLLTPKLQCAPERVPHSKPGLGTSTISVCNHHPSPIWTSSPNPSPKSISVSESNKYKLDWRTTKPETFYYSTSYTLEQLTPWDSVTNTIMDPQACDSVTNTIMDPQTWDSVTNTIMDPQAWDSVTNTIMKPQAWDSLTNTIMDPQSWGSLQVWYDSKESILYITILRARALLTARDNSGLPDPFVKCYLLPDRSMENLRRTRYFSRCSSPEWKQTMVYPDVPPEDLPNRFFEISVWNYDIYRPNEFLGEIVLDLSDETILEDQPRWYKLHDHDESHYPWDPAGGPRTSYSLGSLGSEASGGSGRKATRLNSLALRFPFSTSADEIKRHVSHEKKFIKPFRRKSFGSTSFAKGMVELDN